jgi:Putative prokaryotic signal transducing protein
MSEARVVVFRSYDPIAIELAEAQLEAAQIPAIRLGRGNAALLGGGSSLIEQLLEVAAEQADEARALLASLVSTGEGSANSVEEAVHAPPAEEAGSGKRRFIAAGLSLLWPGLGIAYAGLPLTGLFLGVWSFAALVASPSAAHDAIALVVFGLVLPRLLDLVGAQLWLRRFGRRGISVAAQLAAGLAFVGASYSCQHIFAQPLAQLIASLSMKATAGHWPFDQPPNAAAYATADIVDDGAPILLVFHDGEDHSWLFLSGDPSAQEDAKLISMRTALKQDPTLRTIADLPPGWKATRTSVDSPWIRETYHEDE